MGLLSEGSPLSWPETKQYADHVRKHGIIQFINLYHKLKDRSNDCLRWGDEVEYMLVSFDDAKKTARLILDANRVLKKLQEKEHNSPNSEQISLWRPEYAGYMVEGTPGNPYGHRMAHFNMVEANMRVRREEVMALLDRSHETALTLTSFPRLGCPSFTEPFHAPTPQSGVTRSLFFPDEAIFLGHPRFKTLTRNIRERLNAKVVINIPIYKDKNTPSPFVENLSRYGDDGTSQAAAKADHIYMDAMGFGMGCCCLQMTFQACSISEARHLYDQLTPLCPILLALSAASPIFRGFLSDTDCRWNIIAASVDDRTREERGLDPLKNDKFLIKKSRYDSIDSYLSECSAKYNDIDVTMDLDIYQQLIDAGIDHLLAQHIAHLFIRDPVSLFSEKIHQDDSRDTDHFENIQSTNWQTMRFKPPPPGSPIGWRVEFRPTEVQLTDFENAALVVFIVMLTRVILSFQLSFVIPISKVDENMKRAQKRDAILNQKFYFKKDIMTSDSPPEVESLCCCSKPDKADEERGCCPDNEITELTVDEIINGKPGEFVGLAQYIRTYMDSVDDCDVDTSCTIHQYMHFIRDRASSKLKTTARWIRDFVESHPDYRHDSIVTETINYDLVKRCDDITRGAPCPELIIKHSTKSKDSIPAAMHLAEKSLAEKTEHRRQNGGEQRPSNSTMNSSEGIGGGVSSEELITPLANNVGHV